MSEDQSGKSSLEQSALRATLEQSALRSTMPLPCARFLDAIGIDASSPADLKKLRETLRWADIEQEAKIKRAVDDAMDARERRHERRTRLYGLGFGAVATAIGGVVTWLMAHTTIGFLH